MLDSRVREVLAVPLEPIAAGLVRVGISANAVTLIGFILGLVGAAFVALDLLALGLLFLMLNRLADGIDGAIARRTYVTALGAYLDSVLTYTVFGATAFAFVAARQQLGLAGAFLLFSLLVVAISDLGLCAFIDEQFRFEPSQNSSPLIVVEKTETSLFFLVVLLESLAFVFLPYLFGALCLITAGARLAEVVSGPGSRA